MELHAYLPGVLPEKDLLLTRSGARLALIRVRANGLVFAFDIELHKTVTLDTGWLDSEFKVDSELEDLIIDLNIAGLKTAGCCRGKLNANENAHLDAAYVAFADYFPTDLLANCKQAGFHCMNVSADALLKAPALNYRSRVSPWIRDGSRPPESLTATQLHLNAIFPEMLRSVLDTRVPRRSAEIRSLAEAAIGAFD